VRRKVAMVRESLIAIVRQVAIANSRGSFDADFGVFVDHLEELIEPATQGEKDTARYLLSLMNLLLEMRRRTLPQPVFELFLLNISKSLDHPPVFTAGLLQGEEAVAERHPEVRVGCTMMRWSNFIRHYAPRYGKAQSSADLEKLWSRIEKGDLRVPQEDLHLTGSSGVVWITDEEALYAQCASGPDRIDGTRAYDDLGLDWTSGWSYVRPAAETRAVILKAPVSHRRSADRGLRVPTSVDAWGSFGFVPKMASPPCRWPSNAGTTVDPTCGRERLPEAIHGPHLVDSGAECPVLPCSPVRKAIPDRVDECGRMVCMKVVRMLRSS
jgi:hypothetical protein